MLHSHGYTAGGSAPTTPGPVTSGLRNSKCEFSLFCLLFGNEQKLLKNCNFCFRAKAVFLLNPFSNEILWKTANKKQTRNSTLNGYISKTRVHSESKLKLSESSFKFLQNTLVFCMLHPPGHTAEGSAPTTPSGTTIGSWHSKC